MRYLGGMGKDLPLFSSVCARGARHRDLGQRVWYLSWSCAQPVDIWREVCWTSEKNAEIQWRLCKLSSCLCFMDACLFWPIQGWRTKTGARKKAAPGSGVLGWGEAGREAAAQVTCRMLYLYILVPVVKRCCLWLYPEFIFAHFEYREGISSLEGFSVGFETLWKKPSYAFAVLGGLAKQPKCEVED